MIFRRSSSGLSLILMAAAAAPGQPLEGLARRTVIVRGGSGIIVASDRTGRLVITAAHVAEGSAGSQAQPEQAGRAPRMPPQRQLRATRPAPVEVRFPAKSNSRGECVADLTAGKCECPVVFLGCNPALKTTCESEGPDLALLYCPRSRGLRADRYIQAPSELAFGSPVGLIGNQSGRGEFSFTPEYSPLIRVEPGTQTYLGFGNAFGFDIQGFSGGGVFDRQGRLVGLQLELSRDSLLRAISYNSVHEWIDGKFQQGGNDKSIQDARRLYYGRFRRIQRRPDSVPTPHRREVEIAAGSQTILGSNTSHAVQFRVSKSVTALRNLQIAGELLFKDSSAHKSSEGETIAGYLMPSISALYPVGQDIPFLRGSQFGGAYVGAGYGFLRMTSELFLPPFSEQITGNSSATILEYGWRWRKPSSIWGLQFAGRSVWVRNPIVGISNRLQVVSAGVFLNLRGN